MATAALYTPDVLGLATSLVAWPWNEALPLQGEARSRSCGSTIALGLGIDDSGRIDVIGIRSRACAIGQASAAIFAAGARGLDADGIAAAEAALRGWLAGDNDLPDWPGIAAIAAAREYPARHGAILLAWQAARELLPTA